MVSVVKILLLKSKMRIINNEILYFNAEKIKTIKWKNGEKRICNKCYLNTFCSYGQGNALKQFFFGPCNNYYFIKI